jgi:hypothetical protein
LPKIIDYPIAHEKLIAQGLRCHYHNSGAFGFASDVETFVRGWIGLPDETIKPEMQKHVRQVDEPFEKNITRGLLEFSTGLTGPAWLMPKSHWAYELQFGNQKWMPALLSQIGIDAQQLQDRNTADVIEFSSHERESLEIFAHGLLGNLHGSDFLIAFPGHNILCTIHHHKQLWWITTDAEFIDKLDQLVP